MTTFITSLILLFLPFLLVEFFNDKKKGFIYVLFFLILFHVCLAIITQAFVIFNYYVVLTLTACGDLILLVIYLILRKRKERLKPRFFRPDWILLIVIIISYLTLYQVHYNYTGKINFVADEPLVYHYVKNMRYDYPYFSDEWYAVALIKEALTSHFLPIKNVYTGDFFLNFQIFFHSFLAELMLLLGLDPLTRYNFIAIFFNILIIILVYVLLRLNKISQLIAAISALAILYITCGGGFPGIWHLIPVNLGIIFLLIMFCFMSFGNWKMAIFSFLFMILFYPPFIIFCLPAILVFLFCEFPQVRKKIPQIIGYSLFFLFLIIPIVFLLLLISPLEGLIKYIFSRIFFISLLAPFFPQYPFYQIMPLPIFLLALIGLPFLYKKRQWLLTPLVLGVVFWFIYALTNYRFFIDYERVVFLTAILLSLTSAFGLERLMGYFDKKTAFISQHAKYPLSKYIEVGVIILFLLLVPFYTQRENWQKLVLLEPVSGEKIFPRSPANNYLTKDDLRIFENIKNKRFLSLPWKGTVLGVATGNYPIVIKGGTLTLGSLDLSNKFFNSSCEEKIKIAKKNKIDYVYLWDFNCQEFKKINESREGFVLYEVENN